MSSVDDLADALATTSLWADVGEDERRRAIDAVRQGAYPFDAGGIETPMFAADGEELAEGDVASFLESLAGSMLAAGVPITVAEPDTDQYAVVINGQLCVISADPDEVDWLLATVRPLNQLNMLLDQAGSPMRWHTLLAGGNDGWALLIEPAVSEAMSRSRLFPAADIPSMA